MTPVTVYATNLVAFGLSRVAFERDRAAIGAAHLTKNNKINILDMIWCGQEDSNLHSG